MSSPVCVGTFTCVKAVNTSSPSGCDRILFKVQSNLNTLTPSCEPTDQLTATGGPSRDKPGSTRSVNTAESPLEVVTMPANHRKPWLRVGTFVFVLLVSCRVCFPEFYPEFLQFLWVWTVNGAFPAPTAPCRCLQRCPDVFIQPCSSRDSSRWVTSSVHMRI